MIEYQLLPVQKLFHVIAFLHLPVAGKVQDLTNDVSLSGDNVPASGRVAGKLGSDGSRTQTVLQPLLKLLIFTNFYLLG